MTLLESLSFDTDSQTIDPRGSAFSQKPFDRTLGLFDSEHLNYLKAKFEEYLLVNFSGAY